MKSSIRPWILCECMIVSILRKSSVTNFLHYCSKIRLLLIGTVITLSAEHNKVLKPVNSTDATLNSEVSWRAEICGSNASICLLKRLTSNQTVVQSRKVFSSRNVYAAVQCVSIDLDLRWLAVLQLRNCFWRSKVYKPQDEVTVFSYANEADFVIQRCIYRLGTTAYTRRIYVW